MLFELSVQYDKRGVFIFDSWDIARDLWHKGFHVLYTKGNGIHIDNSTCKEMHKVLKECLVNLMFGRFVSDKCCWPLRSRFRAIIAESRHTRRL